jgi:serine/threonine-protein kinase
MSTTPDVLRAALADRYRIERELGAGGMATVYLAEDVRHRRKVALKVLHPELSAVLGPERFLKEIELTASLQHPHILPLFDSGSADGQLYYVMPFVDGETLRGRLDRESQLPVGEAVRLASEVADALSYAHGRGIVHRDIKPENILLQGGHALVADFGIALAVQQAGGQRMTQTGLSLGTPQYMAPEQAMGEKAVDGRADIYALGAITYEMLTGEAPFTGATAQAIVARVLTEQPRSVTAQRRTVPPLLDAAIRRSLEKLPADRFQTPAQFAESLAAGVRGDTTVAPAAATRTGRRRAVRSLAPWLLAVALGTAFAVQRLREPVSPIGAGSFRMSVALPLGTTPAHVASILLSPDGSRLVFNVWAAGRRVLYSQRLGELEAKPIAGTEGAHRAFVSPDGRWVAFNRGEKLVKVAIDGGTPIALTNDTWGGGSWGTDGRIVFTPSYQEGLWEVSDAGGAATRLTRPDSTKNELGHWWPQVLPDGDHIIFTAYRETAEATTIEVFSRKTKQRTVLLSEGLNARYVSTGHLLFARDESLVAVPFDLGTLKVTGGAVPVVEDLAIADGDGYASYDVAPNGTLAYLPASSYRSDLDIVLVDRRGFARPALPDPARYDNPRLSPDGTRIAVDIAPKGGAPDVWVFPIGGRGTRISDSPSKDWMPNWTPDGRELLYIHESPYYNPWLRVADASQPARQLIGDGHDRVPGSISADGQLVAYVANKNGKTELWTMSLRGEPRERLYVSGVLNASKPVFSPDGRWMAYESEETGRVEVYVQSFPDPSLGRWRVSSNGASEPVWTRGGRELVFRQRDSVMAVPVHPDAKQIGAPVALFAGPYVFHAAWDEGRAYDVSKDGETFLMLRDPGQQRRHIVVTFNWLAELAAKVPR